MSIATLLNQQFAKVAFTAATALCLTTLTMNAAWAGAREQAKYIHDRIAGVAPSNQVLDDMVTDINASDVDAAINTAMDDPNFLNVNVKNLVIPWTNKNQTVFFPFNDAAATVLGYIHEDRDFRGILYDNWIYTINDSGLPAYSVSNNSHYAQAEHQNITLKDALQGQAQSAVTGYNAEAIAGVMTTRASARAFFYAGTNRAMFRFTMMNYLCVDLEEIKDITRTNDRIRQDVSRSPGGDSDVFLNNCIGCHSGMDGMAGAFAYHQWGPAEFDATDTNPDDESMTYVMTATTYPIDGVDIETATRVTQKHRINPTNFKYGHIMTDNSWINYWRTGVNARLGWGQNTVDSNGTSLTPANPISNQTPYESSGIAALGKELANTKQFARCQVLKVYRHVCHADPDESTMDSITTAFEGSDYKMKTIFRESVKDCMASNTNL